MGEVEVGEYLVEWDDEKNNINKKKHGISFETAARIFLDDNRIEYYDELHSNFEDRFRVIGIVNEVLFVVYTEREDSYRLISARQADKSEEGEYYGQYSDL